MFIYLARKFFFRASEDVPNWDANDWSYASGYVTGMIGQAYLTKRAGTASVRFLSFSANGGYGVRLGKFEFMYRTPRVGGGTIISYQSATSKWRLDWDLKRSLHGH
jgi:hypothetical protein